MAYSFSGANYISATSAPVTAMPMTIAVRGIADNTTAQMFVAALGSGSVTAGQFAGVVFGGDQAGDPGRAGIANVGAYWASTPGSFGAGAFYQLVAVFTSTTSRTAYLDNSTATATDDMTSGPSGLSRLGIGALVRQNVGAYLSGDAAEVAMWDVALTADEANSLVKGFAPRRVRPQSLVFYAPLVREAIDYVGGLALTNNGSAAVATHCRVY